MADAVELERTLLRGIGAITTATGLLQAAAPQATRPPTFSETPSFSWAVDPPGSQRSASSR